MKILKHLSRYNTRYLYVSFSLVLVLLIENSFWYLVLLPFFTLYIIKNHTDILPFIALILVVYALSKAYFNNQTLKPSAQYEVKVREVSIKEDYISFTGVIDGHLVKVSTSDVNDIKVGDIFILEGEITLPDNNTFPGGFNYLDYLMSKRIKYVSYNPHLTYQEHRLSVYQTREFINEYIEESLPYSKDYIKTFVLADKSDIDQDISKDINKLGISHLFAVSGFHIALLVLSLDKLLSHLFKKELTRQILITIFLLSFLVITMFTPSVLRAALMYIFLVLNKQLKLELSTIDILSIIFLLIMIINPYSHLNVGFVLSFLVTLFILLSMQLLKTDKKINALFIVGTISFASTIPIIMNLNHQINLLTIIFNVLFVLLMSYIILPLNYITFLFCFLDHFNSLINNLYNSLIKIASVFDFLVINGSFTHPLLIIIYYLFLVLLLIRIETNKPLKKTVTTFILFFLLTINSQIIEPTKRVVFFDVKGDSALITDSFNNCNILIDTGEEDPYHSVLNTLQGRNIRKLDYIIISHFHSDHYGELYTIKDAIKVKEVITNKNVDNYDNKIITCGSINIFIYDMPYDSNNENNNSIILTIQINNDQYLFTGDMEEEREKEFISRYNITTDYIKVPHHGSTTSSTVELLESITPKYAIFSARRNYRDEHPNEEIINRYSDHTVDVSITRDSGTIEYIYLFNKQYKKTYTP